MKTILSRFLTKALVVFTLLLSLLFFSQNLFSQVNTYYFNDVDSTEEYLSNAYCRTLNYYWDQGFMDHQGNIYFVFVDNYKLYYYLSEDDGESWQHFQIETPQDGKIFTAMGALTQDDSLIILYVANQGFSNGTVTYGSEFAYDLYGAVKHKDEWEFTSLKTNSSNSGLLPYGTITTKSGIVHAVLYKYGWYNYGGELYEVMYDPSAMEWSAIETIKIFNDRSVDHGTFHVCKLAEGENDAIICVYQRHAASLSFNNLEVITKSGSTWSEPAVILENSDYATYNRFDLDYDRHGHFYLAYFIPYGLNGPEVYIAHNSVTQFTKYEVFAPVDTLRKISIHPHRDAEAYVYLNFKDSLPEVWKLNQDGFTPTGYLPAFAEEDSADVMRFHYQIPLKNNFSPNLGLYAFTNRYNGRDGATVFKYPLVFVKANLKEEDTGPPETLGDLEDDAFSIFPNPGNGLLQINNAGPDASGPVSIYNATGRLIRVYEMRSDARIDISNLDNGLYILHWEGNGSVLKYVKNK